jgi:enoyl-CoA hydratase
VSGRTALTVGVVERIATITLDRPERRNALDTALLDSLSETVDTLEADDGVDVIILTGADPAFCAGLDLEALAAGELELSAGPDQRGPLPATTKPVIGAINGPAVTGGFELALACDFLVASERARFADTHARVGVMPGWGLSVLLPRAIGVHRARLLSFTGNYLDARMAYEWGLVCEVVAHDRLLEHCHGLAREIATCDRRAVGFLRETYRRVEGLAIDEAWVVEADRARTWFREAAGALDDLEDRRRAIVERGRSQL